LPNVEISINGRLYTVACDDGQQDRVQGLAGVVDARVRQLVGGGPVGMIGETHILVLAGLMLADELDEAQAALAEAESAQAYPEFEDPELLVAAVDHLAERVAVIADRLQRA